VLILALSIPPFSLPTFFPALLPSLLPSLPACLPPSLPLSLPLSLSLSLPPFLPLFFILSPRSRQTNNTWDDRDNFRALPSYYAFVELSTKAQAAEGVGARKHQKPAECGSCIDPRVESLVSMLFDEDTSEFPRPLNFSSILVHDAMWCRMRERP
jgi:hypothetical protein